MQPVDPEELADWITKRMGDLTFREAAKRVGMHHQTIALIAHGKQKRLSEENEAKLGIRLTYDVINEDPFGIGKPVRKPAPAKKAKGRTRKEKP